MTALALDYSRNSWNSTRSISTPFKPWRIPAFASLRVKELTLEQPAIKQQLDEALHNAQTIVRNKQGSLSAEVRLRALARLSELINDENWDEADSMPTRRSTEALFEAIARTNISFMSLSIAVGGELKATWMYGNTTITAVGRDAERISWSKVVETSDSFETETNEGPILEFLGAFAN